MPKLQPDGSLAMTVTFDAGAVTAIQEVADDELTTRVGAVRLLVAESLAARARAAGKPRRTGT
jgi:hypothetical protein